MAAPTVSHPVDDALRAYGLGQLPDKAVAAVARHLETCTECRGRVAALTQDPFVRQLAAAAVGSGTAHQPMPTTTSVAGPLAGLPNYRIDRRLGEGGMGEVYLAHNLLMDRPEVLKVIHKDIVDRPGAVERFLQEVRNAARLQHPNIVAAYSCLQSKQALVLTMEYVPGQNLAELVRATGPLPVTHACHYVRQVALGLQHAHEKKMVHRDVKPHNLMLARDGDKHIVKVLDFGLAKITSEKPQPGGLTSEGRMMGTPDYIAPEQIGDASRADIRADIYSLGCTLYFLLTGRPPFAGAGLYDLLKAHHDSDATPVHEVRLDAPPGLSAVIAKMMAKAPADRYQTPAEVAVAIHQFAQGEPFPPGPTTVQLRPAPVPSPASRSTAAGLSDGGRTREATPPPPTVVFVPPLPPPGRRISTAVLIGLAAFGLMSVGALLAWAIGLFGHPPVGYVLLQGFSDVGAVTVDDAPAKVDRDPATGVPRVHIHVLTQFELVVRDRSGRVIHRDHHQVGKGQIKTVPVPRENPAPIPPPIPDPRPQPPSKPDPVPNPSPKPKDPSTGFFGDPGAFSKVPPLNPFGPPVGPNIVGNPPKKDPPLIAGGRAAMPAGFDSLFNGNDMDEWTRAPCWRIDEGEIVGSGLDGPTYLFTKRSDFQDFDLWAEAKILKGGNSGLFVRAGPVQKNRLPSGFEVQINGNLPENDRTGTLSLNGKVLQSPRADLVADDAYCVILLSVRGSRITIQIDGKPVADVQAPQGPRAGAIALQMHNDRTLVRFRQIGVRDHRSAVKKDSPTLPAATTRRPLLTSKENLEANWDYRRSEWSWGVATLSGKTIKGAPARTDSFLITKETFKDFELEFDIERKWGIGNTGVQIRSNRIGGTFAMEGPQIEIDSIGQMLLIGSLIDHPADRQLAGATQKALQQAWNDLGSNTVKVRCVGTKVQLTVNKNTLIDRDFPNLPLEGRIGLQFPVTAGKEAEVIFKNMSILDLTSDKQ